MRAILRWRFGSTPDDQTETTLETYRERAADVLAALSYLRSCCAGHAFGASWCPMTADEIKAHYAAELKETIIVRRYTGSGTNRPKFDAAVRGKAWDFSDRELIGSIQQGDQRVLVYVDDLIEKGFALPLTSADKVVVKGKEIAIISPGQRKAEDGTLVVYDLQARG